jgi:hypothetical protein
MVRERMGGMPLALRLRAWSGGKLTRGVPTEKCGQLFQQLFEDKTQEDAQKVLAAQATFGER